MNTVKKLLYVGVLLISTTYFFNRASLAEESKSFSISPPNFEISANPGETIKNTIRVENLSNTLLNLKVTSENFVAYGDGGQVNLTDEDSTYSINKWLSYEATTFSIEAHKSYLFPFTLNIPKNAEPGSHYGAVVFANNDSIPTTGSEARVIQEIGALVLIRIPGDLTDEAKLISFAAESNYIFNNNVKLNALVENTGGIHFKMTPYINIYNMFGTKVKSIEVTSHNILPGSQRLFSEEFVFEDFGYYKANIEMFYSNGEKVIRSETGFYNFNLAKSVPIFIAITASIGIYIVFRKRINKAIKIILKG
jgi:hypothetical protein